MTIKELNLTGETEFWTFSLYQTRQALDLLSNLYWLDTNDSNLKENHAFYEMFLNVVDYRLYCDDYEEIKDDNIQKNHLYFCVVQLRSNIAQYRLIVQQKDVESDMQRFSNAAISNINNHINTRYKNFEKSVDGKVEEAVKNIEPQLMSTILTVMGVFSAIITIIMSVVITSSSWLNNADGASALIAFVIPNLVTVISIVVLLGIVFSRKDNLVIVPARDWESPKLVEKQLKKSKRFMFGAIILIVIFITLVLAYSFYELKTQDHPHTRYILSPEMYECVEINNEETNETIVLIEFELNNNSYQIEYDDSYFHNGNLYFCEEHQRLE